MEKETIMKRLISLLFIMLTALGANAQMMNPVTWATEAKETAEGELTVSFTAKIEDGWHVYGTDIPANGPTRTELTLVKQDGVKPLGGLKVKGKLHREKDEMFGMELSFVEGTATFEQRFQLTGGDYDVSGYLTYGACSSQNCTPPNEVNFAYKGTYTAKKSAEDKQSDKKEDKVVEPASDEESLADEELTEESQADSTAEEAKAEGLSQLWTPVISELQSFDALSQGATAGQTGLLTIFLLGLLGGLAALVTPCVWPIIPMTVSFFLKRNKDDRSKSIRDALTYGLSIVVIYVGLGLLVTLLFGASALNSLSTNAVVNILFFLMLVLFGASFLGGFDITLPSSWSNAVDSKAGKTSGLLSIFLMAFTLALVSFSCTGPIIGFLLVEVSTSGSIAAPAIGMLGFAIALALPFTLFALFPTWLKKTPKSGNWMNCIKVSLGFLELAFSLKFLSVADLAYGWHLLDREVFLCLWIVIFACWGAYLIGWIRFPHDEDEYDEMGEVIANPRTSVVRFFLAVYCFAFSLYMVPGLWGAPCKAVSAFAPPMYTQDFNLNNNGEGAHFNDYEEGMAYAQKHAKPVMLDFTGYGCVNCRKMEAAVWTDNEVQHIMSEDYVVISLYVDDKTALPEPMTIQENGQKRTLRTIGDKWSYLQRVKFGSNAQPFYVLVDENGRPLQKSYSYDEDVQAYVRWLRQGLKQHKEQ